MAERCPLCENYSEDVCHLFFDCSVVKELWSYFLKQSSGVGSFVLLQSRCPLDLTAAGRAIWRMVARVVLWPLGGKKLKAI